MNKYQAYFDLLDKVFIIKFIGQPTRFSKKEVLLLIKLFENCLKILKNHILV